MRMNLMTKTKTKKTLYSIVCRREFFDDLRYIFYFKFSISSSQRADEASEGMRQSPRGERVTVPIFGPSGRHERLNCCEKNLR